MEIAYELTQKDFTESFLAHRNRNAITKWIRRIILGLSVAFLAFFLFCAILSHNVRNLMPLVVLIIFWIGIMSGAIWWWSARRQFLKQPGAHGPRTLLLDAAGAHWRWNGGSSNVEWKNYIRWVEGKNQLLFYASPACFNILPKRALTAEQLSEIRELLKQNIVAGK